MTVLRIVPNVASDSVKATRQFYEKLFDLEPVMDLGWIVTLAADPTANVQISIASEGGSGTHVPDISIEVSDVGSTYARAVEMGADIAYELTDEPWGVRRFYVQDPNGKLLNVLSHAGPDNGG